MLQKLIDCRGLKRGFQAWIGGADSLIVNRYRVFSRDVFASSRLEL